MKAQSVYDFSARTIDGKEKKLADYRGQVLLVVNVASECAFTPQYAGLEALHRKFAKRGFAVLGFPCNQFGGQEPGDEAQIKGFCETRFNVTFPLFARIDVNGDNAHPLYRHLKAAEPGLLGSEAIKWNFTKFLVGKDGKVVKRYASTTRPQALEDAVAAELAR